MADVVAVLNAGSSSLKFSLYRSDDAALALLTRGQAEGLFTSPKFVAKEERNFVPIGAAQIEQWFRHEYKSSREREGVDHA